MSLLEELQHHKGQFHPVVPFRKGADKLLLLDFTEANHALTPTVVADTQYFSKYIDDLLGKGYTYGIGGYGEHRTIYARSEHFGGEEPRRLHLGVDIWGKAGTPVFAPVEGSVHSYAYNDNFGDYGATIILQHTLGNYSFYTLYGHLSLRNIEQLHQGKTILKGENFANFGQPHENGHWPPHLHFQVICCEISGYGDYPGVCKYSERDIYLQNCPDPDIFLGMMDLAINEKQQ